MKRSIPLLAVACAFFASAACAQTLYKLVDKNGKVTYSESPPKDFDGQVAVFDLRRAEAPCYNCLFAEDAEAEDVRCAVMGVFAPLVGIVGTFQAMEAIKLVAGVGETLAGRLQIFDALASRWHEVRLARDPHCRVCGEARAAA